MMRRVYRVYLINKDMNDILEEIENINDYTDIRTIINLKKRLDYLNIYNPETRKILLKAKEKGIF